MSAVTHIAGFPCRVGNNLRQRCAWCEHVLLDYDLSLISVGPNADGSPGDGPRPWGTGNLVAVDGPASWIVAHVDGAVLPLNACASPKPGLRLVGEPDGAR